MTERELQELVIQEFHAVLGEPDLQDDGGIALDLSGDPAEAPGKDTASAEAVVQRLLAQAPEEGRATGTPSSEIEGGNVVQEAVAVIGLEPPAPAKPRRQSQETQEGSGDGVAGVIARTALRVLSLGTVPLLSGIIRLFGGGKPEPPPPLIPYTLPPSIQFEAINPHGSTQFRTATYGQDGLPRISSRGEREMDASVLGSAGPNSVSDLRSAPQITVQVQAMDSRSFMDHSNEIAQAVREAMLNMHALNDVVSDF